MKINEITEQQLDEIAPAVVAAVIWVIKFAIRYGAWPVIKWLLKRHGGKIFGGAAAAYYIDQGWDWVTSVIGEEYAQLLIDNKFEIGMAVALILGAVALKKFLERKGEALATKYSESIGEEYKKGPAGQWRNKGPKAKRPAKRGDLVGGGA